MSISLIVIVVLIIVIAIALYAVSNQNKQSMIPNYQRLTPQQYQTAYSTRDHMLIDVRTPEEYSSGHIPGAVNMAIQALPQQMETLPKDRPLVLYCRSGARSSAAAEMLAGQGFEDVHDLGGLIEWKAQGLPTN